MSISDVALTSGAKGRKGVTGRGSPTIDPTSDVRAASKTGRGSRQNSGLLKINQGGSPMRALTPSRSQVNAENLESWRKKLSQKGVLTYAPKSFEAFVFVVNVAPPMQLLETERMGVDAAFLDDMAKRMDISYSHLAETVGIPKATAARKLANNEKISGAAAIALARLLAIANEIVADSMVPEASSFDTARWLGQWIERPQPALGGRKPSELLDTPTGVSMVTKLLGAIRSGAYQ